LVALLWSKCGRSLDSLQTVGDHEAAADRLNWEAMARDKHRGGRTTPKGTRPAHLRPVDRARPDASPVDDMIDMGGRELLDEDDPIAAETWASEILDVFERARWQARLDRMEVPPFEDALLERCRQRRDKRGMAVAAALAAVVPASLDGLARSVVADLRRAVAEVPPWVATVGRVTPSRAWVASDVFGDQDSLVIGFRQQGEHGEHALVILVDHNLSGQAKDAFIGREFDDVVASWKSSADPHMRMGEVPVDDGLRRLRDAMAMSDLWNGDMELRTEEFAQHRALVWARLRRAGLGDERHSEREVAQPEREALIAEFVASGEGRAVADQFPGVDIEILAHYVVNLRCDYEGRPLRWSPTVIEIFLGELAPRKLLLDADEAAVLPAVVRALVRFSAGRTGLDGIFVDEVLAAVDQIEPRFLDRIGELGAAGAAKAMLAALQARGVDLTDVDAINEALERAAPLKLPEATPKARRSKVAAPAEVVSAAASSPVLARFEALVDFYGEGRKLTQKGQPTLADAKALVELLPTRDRIDETIGDRTFRTRSAAELPELGFMIRWALAAGALRKEHGKLRATAAWHKLDGKPLQRWMKAADALPALGPLAAFHAHTRYRDPEEFLDELGPQVLRLLAGGEMPFDQVLDWISEEAEVAYEWLTPYMQDPEHRRTSFGRDLDLLVRILGWARIVERVGATVEPDRYDRGRVVGGTLQLTRLGTWWMTEG
jgi:hypothetical protein